MMRAVVMVRGVFLRVVMPALVMLRGMLRGWIARSFVRGSLPSGGNSPQGKSRDGHCKNTFHWILH